MEAPLIVAVRLYTLAGCPLCDWARNYLTENQIAFQEFVSGGDPVIEAGIATLIRKSKAEFPFLLYAPTKKWILGRHDGKYKRLVDAVRAFVSASTPHAAAAPGNGSGQAANVATEQAPASA